MTWRWWVIIALVIALVGLLAVEAVALGNREKGDTISEIVQGWAFRYPLLPLIVGILLGHFFWPLYPVKPTPTTTPDTQAPHVR